MGLSSFSSSVNNVIMGSSEVDKSGEENEPKTPPPPSSAPVTSQEPSLLWPLLIGLAYSPMPPPHGYVASSPQPHPYMWGVQHMMPPYGTPPHPYGHVSSRDLIHIVPIQCLLLMEWLKLQEILEAVEGDGKQAEAKEKLPIKRSKGSLGSLNMIIGKKNEAGKNSGASANGACSKRHSGSDGTSEGSDANSQNDSGSRHNGKDGETASDSAQGPPRNGSNQPVNQIVPVTPVSATGVPAPQTNLNMGMDYWSGHGTTVPGVVVDGSQSQTWVQRAKRQRRKNQIGSLLVDLGCAECDELAQRADVLNGENASLRAELTSLEANTKSLLLKIVLSRIDFDSPSLEGVNLDVKEQEPETSTRQDVAETLVPAASIVAFAGFNSSVIASLSIFDRLISHSFLLVIDMAKGKLEKSIVADNDSGESVAREDDIVATVEAKLAAWTFLPEENGQSMQILHYENGQKYEPHFDFFHDQVNNSLVVIGSPLSTRLRGMWFCVRLGSFSTGIHHICKYNKDLEHLEELEKRYKAE
ncbi:hypothetical protein HID58_095451 [Brassica napus]|uniref:G-box binding protein multifunctional mosaic region domain-containing protein n=1 Tax=Brassica napus TaxID=3708 RepID=A0ABQ7X625_BRANA|nr:hypothetical protein HID58_095451 [Brassica napus]